MCLRRCCGGEPYDVFRFSQRDWADWPTVNFSGDDACKKPSVVATISRRHRLPADGRIEFVLKRLIHAAYVSLPKKIRQEACRRGEANFTRDFQPIRAGLGGDINRNEIWHFDMKYGCFSD